MTEPEFPPAQPRITVHNFSEKLLETSVEFQVTRLQGQTIIWVGSEPRLGSLAAAVPVKDCPSTSLLQAVFSTLIGRASTRLGSLWSRASLVILYAIKNQLVPYYPLLAPRWFFMA